MDKPYDSDWLRERVGSLREIRADHVDQKDPELTVRWFRGKDIDLQVWLDGNQEVVHFQLYLQNRVLIWDQTKGIILGEPEEDMRGPGMMPASELIQTSREINGLRHSLHVVLEATQLAAPLDLFMSKVLAAIQEAPE